MDPVIIVGAGPVGLSLALALARQEVPSVVLDEGSGLCPEGPRSTVLRPDTAAFLARIGYPRVSGDACSWSAWRTLRRRTELVHLPLEPGEALHLAQHRLQRGLRDAAAASPLVELVADSRAGEVEQDATGVAVQASGTWWRGSHVVGCDGHRSTVRKQLGLRFPGRAVADRYAVATVRTELPFPEEARLHRDPPFDPATREVAARPLPDHVWRLDWRLPRSAPAGPLPADELVARLRAALAGWCGEVPRYELISSSDRPVPQRLATRFRVGRAFLAGDAAHLLGALGMQNLDEGLRDADNLAWKLGLVWHRQAPDTLLDSYQRERRGAVIARLRSVDQALPLLHPSSPLREARRSLFSGSLRRHAQLLSEGSLGTGRLGGPPAYPLLPGEPAPRGAATAVLSTDLGPTEPGVLAHDVPVVCTDGTRDRLRARLGRGLLVVLVAPGTDVWASEHWLGAGLMPGLSEATRGLPVPAELLVTGAYPAAAPHTVLLIRPDGHLAAVLPGLRPDELWQAADRARGGVESLPAPRSAAGEAEADPVAATAS